MFGWLRKKPQAPYRPKLDYEVQVRRARDAVTQHAPPHRVAMVMPDGGFRLVALPLAGAEAEAAAEWLQRVEPHPPPLNVGAIAVIPAGESLADYNASIPFFSTLLALAWGGHIVTVVNPGTDVLYGICRDADLLFVDGVRWDVFQQQDIPALALSLMRRPRLFLHDGQGGLLELGKPPPVDGGQ